mgnify:CR=1 FL=1
MSLNQKTKLFDSFYEWLKPKKSERLHKKTIFTALINNDHMTNENLEDFLFDRTRNGINLLINKTIVIEDTRMLIMEVKIINNDEFHLKTNIKTFRCKYNDLERIQKQI